MGEARGSTPLPQTPCGRCSSRCISVSKRRPRIRMTKSRLATAALALTTVWAAELPKAPPAPRPDDRFKADILVIVAHPDDETAVTGYLAKAIFDDHRRVAVVLGTPC